MLILKCGKAFTSKDMVKRVGINWKTSKMTSFLKKLNGVESIKGNPLKFRLSHPSNNQMEIFRKGSISNIKENTVE